MTYQKYGPGLLRGHKRAGLHPPAHPPFQFCRRFRRAVLGVDCITSPNGGNSNPASNVRSWMKIVQIDGDEVAQHGTLELLILESSNRHRTWLIASKSSERALGKEKSRPRRLLIKAEDRGWVGHRARRIVTYLLSHPCPKPRGGTVVWWPQFALEPAWCLIRFQRIGGSSVRCSSVSCRTNVSRGERADHYPRARLASRVA